MKSFSNKDHTDIQTKINLKCWKDPQFKKKLLKDPQGALRDLGCNFSPDTKVRIVEPHENEIIFQLYPTPHNTDNLSDNELKKVAAAGTVNLDTWWLHG